MMEQLRWGRWRSAAAGFLLGVIVGGVATGWAAQKEPEPQGQEAQMLLPAKTLDDIYKKLEELKEQAKRYGARATEVLEKMDVVLRGQEEMKAELVKIRVRASR